MYLVKNYICCNTMYGVPLGNGIHVKLLRIGLFALTALANSKRLNQEQVLGNLPNAESNPDADDCDA